MVEGLVSLNDPKCFAGGNIASGRVSHVSQVEEEGPDQASPNLLPCG